MLAEMASNPLGFMLMRLDMSEIPWVEVNLRHESPKGVVTFRTRATRPSEFRPVYQTPYGPVKAAVCALAPPEPMMVTLAVEFLERDLADQAYVDVNWQRLVDTVKRFIGAAWSIVRVLSEEQAWERIKWIWGETVESNPWV